MITPLLKPCQMKRRPIPVFEVTDDGKEICSNTPKGRAEYRNRTLAMAERQGWVCRWCEKPMRLGDVSFEHDNGRTKGNQDDRIEVGGVPQNAATHGGCNCERGSSRILTRVEWLAWKANKYEPLLDSSEIRLVRDCGYAYPPEV